MRKKHTKFPELGKCKVGDIIKGCILTDKLIIKRIVYDKTLFANLYFCEYIEGRRKGLHEEIYEFYNYEKVAQ